MTKRPYPRRLSPKALQVRLNKVNDAFIEDTRAYVISVAKSYRVPPGVALELTVAVLLDLCIDCKPDTVNEREILTALVNRALAARERLTATDAGNPETLPPPPPSVPRKPDNPIQHRLPL